jgi:hypothetical protein
VSQLALALVERADAQQAGDREVIGSRAPHAACRILAMPAEA